MLFWMTAPEPPSADPWRDTFIALLLGASHEFNNKLTAIVSLSDLFLNELPSQHPMASGLSTMRSTAYGISEVLHQLAAQYFAHIGQRELFDLNSVANEVTALLRRCVSSRVEVACEIHSQPLPVTGDAVWLRRVLLVLAILATRRTAERGVIKLRTSGGAQAAVAVRIEGLDEKALVRRDGEERAALDEAGHFASAHGGTFQATNLEFVLTMALETSL
jgi:signal transduction histidine kinase